VAVSDVVWEKRRGKGESAPLAVVTGIVGLTPEEVAALRAGPRWPLPAGRRPGGGAGVPGRGRLGVPARPARRDLGPSPAAGRRRDPPLLKAGTDRAAAAIPGARVLVLDGHAHLRDPAMVAAIIRRLAPP
jgi:hypothetical protein